jgi:hypothetical protein
MKVLSPTWGEIAYRQCMTMLGGNYLSIPQYYSQLFQTFRMLLVPEDQEKLNQMIKDVEDWLSDKYNPLTLQEAEIRMWNNMDLNSGFQVNGVLITQNEIYQRLDIIKNWLRGMIGEYLPYIRFTQQLRVD